MKALITILTLTITSTLWASPFLEANYFQCQGPTMAIDLNLKEGLVYYSGPGLMGDQPMTVLKNLSEVNFKKGGHEFHTQLILGYVPDLKNVEIRFSTPKMNLNTVNEASTAKIVAIRVEQAQSIGGPNLIHGPLARYQPEILDCNGSIK